LIDARTECCDVESLDGAVSAADAEADAEMPTDCRIAEMLGLINTTAPV